MSEKDGPLLTLGWRLRCLGPPSLTMLMAQLEGAEAYTDFVALVRELLPEWEQDILRQPSPEEQIAAFASRFQDRYFPLEDRAMLGDFEEYGLFLQGIPVIVMGLSFDDYHYLPHDGCPGILLMTYLLEDPDQEEDARIALAEACSAHVPRELLQRVPEGGLTAEQAHRLLDGTQFEGVARWADMLQGGTGNFFLDVCYEELWETDFPQWDREVVEELAQQWPQAERAQQQLRDLADRLEEDPPARFQELLELIEL